MRLSPKTKEIICQLVLKNFGEGVPVRLFGSRINDLARGGDIDLHIIAPRATYQNEVNFLTDAERLIDERVDIRVQKEGILFIDQIAIKSGVLLNL